MPRTVAFGFVGALGGLSGAMTDAMADEPDIAGPENGGFLEIGAVIGASRGIRVRADETARRALDGELGFYLAGAWRHGPLFADFRRGGADGVSLGATLWQGDGRALELLAVNVPGIARVGRTISGRDDEPAATDAEREADLLDRGDLFGTSGLRYREYRGDSLAQLSAVVDWQNGNGVLLGADLGHQWQFGNWNVQGVAGLRWAGSELVDFVYGIDEEEEASTRFPAYEADASLYGIVDLGATRALGKDWVLRSNLNVRTFGAGITDSPLVARSEAVSFETGIAYVF